MIIKLYENSTLEVCSSSLNAEMELPELHYPTTTHKQGGHLDQIFVKNMKVIESTLSEDFIDDISDHKCLKVTMKIQERTPPVQIRNMNNIRYTPVINEENFKLLLP